jgi:hypothetical protein
MANINLATQQAVFTAMGAGTSTTKPKSVAALHAISDTVRNAVMVTHGQL